MPEFIVSSPQRLDAFLASQSSIPSRNAAQKLIKGGKVTVNGKVVKKPAYILKEGDSVSLAEVSEPQLRETLESVDLHLNVLYEDDTCMVINKPAGIAVHPASSIEKGEKTILNGIEFLFKKRAIPFSPDATLVHRLDKETTGCLLIAKTPEAHKKLQEQFEKRTVSKTYLALVAGVPSPAEAYIDAPIGRNLIDRTLMSIFKTRKSRAAKTLYRTVKAKGDSALLECDLHTGRTHQIRVHLHSIGHPILGDPTYATSDSEEVTKKYGIEGLCLHALKLEFISPFTQERVEVEAPEAGWMVKWL